MPITAERVIVEDALLRALHGAGYDALAPEGLVTPLFPDTFAASAFHTQIVEAMTRQAAIGRKAGVEWVFRHVDGDKVGYSPAHLSLFRMLVYFDASTADAHTQRRDAVARFLELTTLLGLRRDHITVTYFGGGDISGRTIPPDGLFADAWFAAGIARHRIIPVVGQANFTNIRRAGEPAGPRCEVYYDAPGHPSAVEIGTVVCEQYVLDDTGQPEPTRLSVCGGAFGVERLEMCARGLLTIAEVTALDRLVTLVLTDVPPHARTVFRTPAIRIANGLRALAVIAAHTGIGGVNGRVPRINAITRDVLRAARECGVILTDNLIRACATSVPLCEADRAPHADRALQVVAEWITRRRRE